MGRLATRPSAPGIAWTNTAADAGLAARTAVDAERRRGRGAVSNASGRFETLARVDIDDGWRSLEELPPFRTVVTEESARRVIARNDSPDLGFDRSINPYRGCEHGCVYCYARPSHAYMGLSPGLDFETKLFAKPDAPDLLAKELAAPGYEPKTIALGSNTDPYQPIEKRYQITRRILDVLARADHPVGIVTKSALIQRDIDILTPMARKGLAKVAISVTTMDARLARTMEPRAATPARRLETIRALSEAGIPVAVLVAPIIPALNDAEIERILDAAKGNGASEAGYVMLRLPLELKNIMREWLIANYPDRYRHVLALVREMRGGRDYDAEFFRRQKGDGPYAWMVGRRFETACRRLGLNRRSLKLSTGLFRKPARAGQQLSLF